MRTTLDWRRKGLAGIGVAALALALTACGGSDSTETDAAAATPSATGEITMPAKDDALAAELAATGNNGTLITATDMTIGLPWASQEGSTPVGLDIDLADALGAVLGAEIDLQNTSFDSLIPGLAAGRYDLTVSAMIDNAKRQEQVDFVDFIKGASGFSVPVDSDLDDLTVETTCGLSVGVVRGSVEEMYLTEQQAKCSEKIDLQVFQQLQQATLALTSGRIEALLADGTQNGYLASLPGARTKVSGAPVGEAPVGMALPKDSELVPVIQKALQKLMDDGTYDAILEKYGVTDFAYDSATVNENVS